MLFIQKNKKFINSYYYSVLAANVPIPLFSTPPLAALAATFLGWFLSREQDSEDTFNWNVLNLTQKHKEELKATLENMVKIVNEEENLSGWESQLFECEKFAQISFSLLF